MFIEAILMAFQPLDVSRNLYTNFVMYPCRTYMLFNHVLRYFHAINSWYGHKIKISTSLFCTSPLNFDVEFKMY